MSPKKLGCCSKCDKEVFEILKRDSDTRLPIKVGAPLDNAVRANFQLIDGSSMDLTLCDECANSLTAQDHAFLWQRAMLSWVDESGGDHPWIKRQTSNGIFALLHKQSWDAIT